MIDLDGVLNNYINFDEDFIPEIREGAKEFLQSLSDTGEYELYLFITRNKMIQRIKLKTFRLIGSKYKK